jgi:hypothetical protein
VRRNKKLSLRDMRDRIFLGNNPANNIERAKVRDESEKGVFWVLFW